MKIVHINTYFGNGGAGRACLRLSNALNEHGVQSEVWVNFSFDKSAQPRSFSKGFFNKWATAGGIILERIVAKFFLKPLRIPFSFPVWGKDISAHRSLLSADIIHLHWINHAFLRPKDLAKLEKLGKPIVWTFHDSNAFTGGCHVRYGCEHFHHECGNCPVLKNAHANDWSHKIWVAKAKTYSKLHFHIIAPSKWMAGSVKDSKLLGMRQVSNIPNTLDTAVFKPHTKHDARRTLGLPAHKFILLSGFMPSRKDLHKGTSYLLKALELFIRDNPAAKETTELVVFGNRDTENVPQFPVKTTFLGTISSDEKLSLCYSAADAFLAPSLEDNLPNTVMESMSCGTPVVAFSTGGIPDMVDHLNNGYLAAYKSSADLAAGIQWVYEHPERNLLNIHARTTVETKFSEKVVAGQHIELYKSLLTS